MTRLITFTGADGKKVGINPDVVAEVKELHRNASLHEQTRIVLWDASREFVVLASYDDVVRQLLNRQNRPPIRPGGQPA